MAENWEAKSNAVIEWLKAGMTIAAAANLSGFSETEIIGLANTVRVPALVPAPSWLKAPVQVAEHAERNAEIKRRYEAGERPRHLAGAFGLDDSRVQQILNRAGAQKWMHIKHRDEKAAKHKVNGNGGYHHQPRVAQYAQVQERAPRRAPMPEEARLQIGMRYAAGEDLKAIGADYGINPHSCAWIANKLGYFRPGYGPGISVITRLREMAATAKDANSN